MRKVVLVCGACLALSGCGSFGWSGIADPFDGQGAYSTAAGPESGGDGAVGMALAEARTQPAGAQVAMSGGQQVRQPQVADGAQGEQAMPEAAAVKSALETGSAQFAKGHYGLALQSFRAALWRSHDSVRALNGLAAVYDRLGRFDLSERYYERALALDPDSPRTLNNLGYSYFLQGRKEDAVACLERAASFLPDSKRVRANLDLAYAIEGGSKSIEVAELQPKPIPRAWIEKTGERVYTLVTHPDPELLAEARHLGVDPRLVSMAGSHAER